jgi:glycosyltransferase involved in cell wall biosynthesis
MRVWIITIGEPLPVDPGQERLLRSGILANALRDRGHEVVWWTSTFNHMLKSFRAGSAVDIDSGPGLRIKLLHSTAYDKNISLNRLVNHRGLARQFEQMAPREDRPDVILCSFPTIEFSSAATSYGLSHGVPVVLDARDQWPDIFLNLAPWGTRWLARLALSPLFRATRAAFSRATAITGITDRFVEWGARYAGRPRGELDAAFPMAYSDQAPEAGKIAAAEAFWDAKGIVRSGGKFIVCFFGTLGRQFDLETVIDAARRLQQENIVFVLCGTGDKLEHYKALAAGCGNILFPGWVGTPEIWVLMRRSALGLAPYHSEASFTQSLPNKSLEYLSAGLPVLSSLRGELEQLLSLNECGLTYRNHDVNDLVGKAMQAKSDPALLTRMSQNATRTYRARFVAEDVYRRMSEHLERVAAAGARKSVK